MTHPYSHTIFNVSGLASTPVLFDVPGDLVLVIRDYTAYVNSTLADTHMTVNDHTTGALLYRHNAAHGQTVYDHLDVRQVIESGHQIRAFTDGAEWDLVVSGYLLSST
jgi:hypothetical protein